MAGMFFTSSALALLKAMILFLLTPGHAGVLMSECTESVTGGGIIARIGVACAMCFRPSFRSKSPTPDRERLEAKVVGERTGCSPKASVEREPEDHLDGVHRATSSDRGAP